MPHLRHHPLLLALLLLVAQWLLAVHGVEHVHAAPHQDETGVCHWCAVGGPALPVQTSPPAVPRQAAGVVVLSHWAEPPTARPSLPPPVRGPPDFSLRLAASAA
jgi:hypothetical protein